MPKIKKLVSFKADARRKLLEGVEELANAVTTTLGPKGRNVAIQRQWGAPIIVHDGVTVAREMDSDDALKAIGMNLVKVAAQKTNEEAGDGTTTATLLAYEIVRRGMEMIDKAENAMILRKDILAVIPKLTKALKEMSRECRGLEDLKLVATVSSTSPEIGTLVAEALDKVGLDGLVTVDENSTTENVVEMTEGMEFDKGYAHFYFVTNADRMEAVVNDPAIILADRKISLNDEIVPLLELVAKTTKDIVIIATEISGDALATLVANKRKGNIQAIAINAPGIGDNKTNYLEDIAVLTGGKVLSDKYEVDINADLSWLGHAKKVNSTKDSSLIVGGKGDKEEITKRIDSLRIQKENETSIFEKEKLEERLARLTTGVAVIKVGAKTEIDMRENIERVKDAVGAAQSARKEGVVVGGGSIFLHLSKYIDGDTAGEKLLKEALESPARKVMFNSGENDATINQNVKDILQSKADSGLGYDVASGKMTNLFESGVIDPTKVVRLALENAVNVGTSILTTDCLIGFEVEEDRHE